MFTHADALRRATRIERLHNACTIWASHAITFPFVARPAWQRCRSFGTGKRAAAELKAPLRSPDSQRPAQTKPRRATSKEIRVQHAGPSDPSSTCELPCHRRHSTVGAAPHSIQKALPSGPKRRYPPSTCAPLKMLVAGHKAPHWP